MIKTPEPFTTCGADLRYVQAIHQATHPGCQTDKEGVAANDETAAQDKTTSAE